MAVGVVMEFEGATLDQYDQVVAKMGFTRGGEGAPGGIFHWVMATDNGIRVTDVWESRELFEKFAQEQIGPYTQEVGIPGPPQISFYDVHNYLTAGATVAA
jgi:hypothetical protein